MEPELSTQVGHARERTPPLHLSPVCKLGAHSLSLAGHRRDETGAHTVPGPGTESPLPQGGIYVRGAWGEPGLFSGPHWDEEGVGGWPAIQPD